MWLEFSLNDFTYKEFSSSGTLLDREDGLLPGIGAGITFKDDRFFIEGRFSYQQYEVTYRGQTQSGIPVSTDTDETIYDWSAIAGVWDQTTQSYAFQFGGGYRSWERDIQPTSIGATPVAGLFEVYEWFYFQGGFRWLVTQRADLSFVIDTRITLPLAPQMTADIVDPSNGNKTRIGTFDLGEEFGLRIAGPISIKLARGKTLRIEPFVEYFEFGRSPVVNGFLEPDSETLNIGVIAAYHF